MRTWYAWVVGMAALSQFPLGCSSSSPSSSESPATASSQLRGSYHATGAGPIRELDFYDATHYSLSRTSCAVGAQPAPGATECRESGSYALNADRTELSLVNASTGETTKLPFQTLRAGSSLGGAPVATQALRVQDLAGDAGGLYQDAGPLISSFQAGPQDFQGCGQAMAQRANDNLGKAACDQTSTGDQAYGSSCTGNGGQPEYWCADFVKWVWSSMGADVGGLSAAAGSFYVYGQNHGTLSNTPHPGDAVVFDYHGDGTADHVAIVSTVSQDGAIETISGDWNGQGEDEAAFSSTSHVIANTPAYPGTVGSSPGAIGMSISGFISPVGGNCGNGGS